MSHSRIRDSRLYSHTPGPSNMTGKDVPGEEAEGGITVSAVFFSEEARMDSS